LAICFPNINVLGDMMGGNELISMSNGDESVFYEQVSELLASARRFAKRQLDSVIVATYYEMGRMIVEREQQGQKRAQYGAKLIKGLSEYLSERYGKGFSVVNLKSIRKFYLVYAPSIGQTLSAFSEKRGSRRYVFDEKAQKEQTLSAKFNLGWSHYQNWHSAVQGKERQHRRINPAERREHICVGIQPLFARQGASAA
jgi:hypothetical protein